MTPRARKIAAAARAAFEESRRAHPDERFYVYALFSEDGDDLQPTCNSEQALARQIERTRMPEPEARWFAEEFAYHQVGEAHFAGLSARGGFGPAIEALGSLNADGFFGKGAARAAVTVLILRSDQNNREVVEICRQLNPRAVWPRIEAAFEVAAPTGKPTLLPGKEAYSIDSLALSADGRTLAAGGWFGDPELRVWRLGARPREVVLKRRPREGMRSLAMAPDGRVVYGADEQAIWRWQLPAGTPLPVIAAPGVQALAACADGSLLAVQRARLRRWDADGTPGQDAPAHPALAGAMALSPDGARLVVKVETGEALVLDAATLAPLAQFSSAKRPFRCVAASNQVLAGGSYAAGGPIVLWQDGRTRELPGHAKEGVSALSFSRDGKRLASAGEDGHVRVFDLASGALLADVRGRQEAMSAVLFLADGRLAAGGRDTSYGPPVYVWKLPRAARKT